MNKKDTREPDRQYTFPTDAAKKEEAARKSEEIEAQKGPSIDEKDHKAKEK